VILRCLFFILFSLRSWCLASSFSSVDLFAESLQKIDGFQNSKSCLKDMKIPSQCSSVVSKLVEDDLTDRSLGLIESGANICQREFEISKSKNSKDLQDIRNAKFLQDAFEKNKFSNLGEYTHQSIKACLHQSSDTNTAVVSKFYYYTARLNATSARLSEEQKQIDHLLKNKSSECPNEFLLNAAYKSCKDVQSCALSQNINQLSAQTEIDENLFLEATARLAQLSKTCDTEVICKNEKLLLSRFVAGAVSKNPWFLDSDFKETKGKYPTKIRVEKYLKASSKNLKKTQQQIEKVALCIHRDGQQDCDLDEIRDILTLTQDLPDDSGVQNIDKILNRHLHLNSCLEEKSIDRNKSSKIIDDTVKSSFLGLIALPIGARLVAGKVANVAWTRLSALIGSDVAVNLASSVDTWKDFGQDCFAKKALKSQLKMNDTKNICENSSVSLSQVSQDQASCLMSSALSAISLLPIGINGAQLVALGKSAGYIGSNAKLIVAEGAELAKESKVIEQTSNLQRTSDSARTIREHRIATPKRMKVGLEARSALEVKPNIMPNMPTHMKVLEVEKRDGTSALFFKTREQLQDGTWVATHREFQIDEGTGAIAANYPAGLEVFNKIAAEKAGKAYFAFIDVGILGKVSKTFKSGDAGGDRYLKAVAETILKNGEGKITLARKGGDEFFLIIDEPNPVKAKEILEKIQTEIRKNTTGDARVVFRDEKISRAEDYKEALEKLKSQFPEGVPQDKMDELRKAIDDLARNQQPDISIGLTQIGHADDIEDLSSRAEALAKDMKVKTALQFGRSVEKYGVEATPNAKPKPLYMAEVALPAKSPSWTATISDVVKAGEKKPNLETLPDMKVAQKETLIRFDNISVARYEDQLGRSTYQTERYVLDTATNTRIPIYTEIPTRGTTGLLDGKHPEGQKLIFQHLQTSPDVMLVMPKLKSLKYLNYFESGTEAGDEVLAAVADVLRKNMRSSDLSFKMDGADFLWSLPKLSDTDLFKRGKKMSDELAQSPRVLAVIAKEVAAIQSKIEIMKAAKNFTQVDKLKTKLEAVKNFKLDLEFQSLNQTEIGTQSSIKDIEKKFDAKFNK
jgi:GGDEF domain-containing protein